MSTDVTLSSSHAKMWWLATSLLVAMACIFIVATQFMNAYPGQYPWLGALRAFTEAAMVGALADWFAVTALFRRPLGLPIPHTAIVPSNKSRIGRSLGLFVQRNFLSDQVLDGEAVNISGAITRWLDVPENRKGIIRRVRLFVPRMLETIEDGEIKHFIDSQIEAGARRIDFSKVAGKVLTLFTANGLHEVLLDEMVKQSRSFFRSNQDWFKKEIRDASPWFVPEFVDRKIFDAIVSKTEETLTAALNDRNHELRLRVHAAMEGFIQKLLESDEFQARGDEVRELLLDNKVFRDYVGSVRDGFLRALKSDIAKDDSQLTDAVERMLEGFVSTVSGSPDLQRRLNRLIRRLFTAAAGDQSNHVADLIARTVDSWNTSTLVSKLEEQVGSDLQYIRINGTLVGGLVGLVIYSVESALR